MKRKPITIKEFKEGEFIQPFYRIKKVSDWLFPQMPRIFKKKTWDEHAERSMRLTQNNKQWFLDKYGKQDFVWTGEYKEYAWSFEFTSGGILLIFTGNRGTSYHTNLTDFTDVTFKEFKDFLDIVGK